MPKAKLNNFEVTMPILQKLEDQFDPEGDGYDYKAAKRYGVKPDKTGHWASRASNGQILKGRKHKTYYKTVAGEKKAGYKIHRGSDGKYYSQKLR